jgi:hypothetical protein
LQISVADNPAMGLTHLIEGNEPTKKRQEYDDQASQTQQNHRNRLQLPEGQGDEVSSSRNRLPHSFKKRVEL